MTNIDTMTDDEFLAFFTPARPHYLDEYSIEIRNESNVTAYWDGQVRHKGGVILHVENSGQGGCNRYDLVSCRADKEAFMDACKQAYAEGTTEPEDLACLFMEYRDEVKK